MLAGQADCHMADTICEAASHQEESLYTPL